MSMLYFFIGCLFGIFCCYLYTMQSSKRIELSSNQVLFTQIDEAPPQVRSLKVIRFWGEKPNIYTTKPTLHNFEFINSSALICRDSERVDLVIQIQITPINEEKVLNELFSFAHPLDIQDVDWQRKLLQPFCVGSLNFIQQNTREHWLNNKAQIQELLDEELKQNLTRWQHTVVVINIQPTTDQYYNLESPEEKSNTLQRQKKYWENQEIETQIAKHQESLKSQQELSDQVEEHSHTLAKKEQALADRKQTFEESISQLQSDIHTQMELLKSGIQKDIGSLSMLTRKDLAAKGLAVPQQLNQNILRKKNTLIAQIEKKKREELKDTEPITKLDDES
jgi:hypothetical protein